MTEPNLEMYKSSDNTQVGTEGIPIDFGLCDAAEETFLPYDILLYNDKGSILGSDDAKNIKIELLRLFITQEFTSPGTASYFETMSFIPVVDEVNVEVEVLVDDEEWRRVASFSELSSEDKVYTFDYITGVLTFGNGSEGKIPPLDTIIKVTYTPNLNIYGKEIYEDKWVLIKSDGVMSSEVHIGETIPEECDKINNDTVRTLHYPKLTEIIGVWDNINKTGTEYYGVSGSFEENSGIINLTTPFTESTPYVEYKYEIKDDEESFYTELGNGVRKELENSIPKNNAKKLQLKVKVPDEAGTEGGAYLKILLRILYQY